MVRVRRAVSRRSTFRDGSSCVEVAKTEVEFAVRDSKDLTGHMLRFSAHEWQAFFGRITRVAFAGGVLALGGFLLERL